MAKSAALPGSSKTFEATVGGLVMEGRVEGGEVFKDRSDLGHGRPCRMAG